MGRSLTVAGVAAVPPALVLRERQAGSGPGMRAADHGQGDRGSPAGRECRGGHEADALPLGLDGRAGSGGMCRGFEPQSPEELVHVPQGVDPGDRLLAEIAALHEVDRPIVAADLLGQVPLRHIAAEDRRAGLDPQDLEGVAVELGQAQPRTQGPERAGDPPGGAAGSDERESGPARGRLAHDQQGTIRDRRWPDGRARPGPGSSPPASLTSSSARGPARWNSKVDSDRSSRTMSSNTPYFWKWGKASTSPPGSVHTRIESTHARSFTYASVFPWGLVMNDSHPYPTASRLTSFVVRLCRNLARSGPATSSLTRPDRSPSSRSHQRLGNL